VLAPDGFTAGFNASITATIAGALIVAACARWGCSHAAIAYWRQDLRAAGRADRDLGDRNWELKEAAERSRSFLESASAT